MKPLETNKADATLEKRMGDKPVPDNVEKHLNNLQILSLRRLENFGYRLKFIRRPLFQDVVVVVVDPQEKTLGVLKEDGSLDLHSEIQFRE
jgi:hypothetical protein